MCVCVFSPNGTLEDKAEIAHCLNSFRAEHESRSSALLSYIRKIWEETLQLKVGGGVKGMELAEDGITENVVYIG